MTKLGKRLIKSVGQGITMVQLQNDLDAATKRASDAVEEAVKLRGTVWRLETENKSLTQQVADARKGWETAIYEKAKIEGYMLRVREEDAKSIGKVWHEAFEKDAFGNPVFR